MCLLPFDRVLNVVRHWIDQHWYDFEWNQNLLDRLQRFLETVKGKAMRKCVESIHKAINRRVSMVLDKSCNTWFIRAIRLQIFTEK